MDLRGAILHRAQVLAKVVLHHTSPRGSSTGVPQLFPGAQRQTPAYGAQCAQGSPHSIWRSLTPNGPHQPQPAQPRVGFLRPRLHHTIRFGSGQLLVLVGWVGVASIALEFGMSVAILLR